MTKRTAFNPQEAAEMFKALADPTRVAIVALLAEKGAQTVGAVCKALSLPQPSASYHLKNLRLSRVLVAERDGKNVFYALAEGFRTALAGTVQRLIGG